MAPRAAAAALVLAVAALAGCGGGSSSGAVRVATDATYPPFESVEASGAIVGFDVDLVRAIAKEGGFAVEFVNQPFDGILPGLNQGKYDLVVSCLTITPERAAQVAFSDPYYDAGQVIAVREGETGIRGLADLKGRTIAVQRNTTGQSAAERATDPEKVRKFDAVEPAFLELLAKRADAVINDEPTTRLFAKAHAGVRIAGAPFTEERYGIAVRKGDAALLAKINAGLAKVRASGEYDRLKERWIGK